MRGAREHLAWPQVAYPDWYLKTHQDEGDLGVKEKAEKRKGIIPRSAKAEKMPEAANNKDSKPCYKSLLSADGKHMPCCTETGF